MHRASPPRIVSQFDKDTVSAAEVFGVDFQLSDFVNLRDSRMVSSGGFAQGVKALLPDKENYDQLVFFFSPATLTDVEDATLTLYGVGSEGVPYVLGTSELGADGQFPAIVCDNRQERYYLAVSSISGSGATVSVQTFVSGTYRFLVAPNR